MWAGAGQIVSVMELLLKMDDRLTRTEEQVGKMRGEMATLRRDEKECKLNFASLLQGTARNPIKKLGREST